MSLGDILNVGARQALGLLLGFAAVAVVDVSVLEPLTKGGAAILIIISVLIVNLMAPAVQALWRWAISR